MPWSLPRFHRHNLPGRLQGVEGSPGSFVLVTLSPVSDSGDLAFCREGFY